ncbi:terminase TerL endonuclease subunit [Clostridium sp. CCUG 7971]|uniref:terminase large subunit n=1 Tax=Clostridium sp. CCUG 7971 TaxID=2811414 RepID=UPI001ABA6A9D|nr:terminase TerL endonuclease subunit [Clostridium sp. CCUG 7971]MBO3443405.1 terminase large subunit [Clostridium sp. CCUG 7971]
MFDRVTEYAERVVNGEVTAGKLHILACKRHLNDLERQNTIEFPYYWDVEKANRIIDYAETLTIAEGSEPKEVKLLDCQAFDIAVPFGWFKSNGKRRFRRKYKSMARQNGKTFENGITGTYVAGFSGYKFGKLFTVATKKRQARLAWEEMSKFINIDEDLNELFIVQDYKSLITAIESNCTIEALSRESGLDDGFRSIYSSIDELHQHRDNKIYKAIYNGTRALSETLVSMITTRGDKLNSFCKEMDDYCIKILNGTTTAEDFFVDIYCLDKDDDIWDESNWIKANPFLASSEEGLETLKTDAKTARDMGGSDLRDFLTKCLNMWVQNSDDQFINVEKWKKCGSKRTLEDFRYRECWVGLDLSSGGDLTTLALEFEEDNEEYYLYSHSFMPRGRLEEHIETDLSPYDLWETMELLTVTGGSGDYKNDYKFIIKHLKELQEEYNLKFLGIGIDPHNADGVLSDLEEFGCPILMVTQSAKFLNDATVDMQLAVKSEKIEYNRENELLTWSFTNAKIVKNSFGEMKVDKEPRARFKRIDPVDAAIDAHAVRMKFSTKEVVDVKSELDNYLEKMGWKK